MSKITLITAYNFKDQFKGLLISFQYWQIINIINQALLKLKVNKYNKSYIININIKFEILKKWLTEEGVLMETRWILYY